MTTLDKYEYNLKLEEIDKLGKKAVDRIFPEGEKGGCASQGIQITKESLRQSIYAVL